MDIELIVNSITAVIAAYIVYCLGLSAYFKQKEYENVRTRYLDNGVELVISQIDYALAIYRNNWALMLRTTRQFRELEEHVSLEDFLNQFKELNQESFQLAPAYKLKTMFNSDVIWNAYQSVFSFVGTTNDEIKTDFYGVLKSSLENPQNIYKKGFIEEVEKFSRESNAKSNKYYLIINTLHQIAEMLEKEKYTIKKIYDLKNTSEIRAFESTLLEHFPDEVNAQQGVQAGQANSGLPLN